MTDESGEKNVGEQARGFNRRLFLKGTAAASLGTAAAASGLTPTGVLSTAAAAELPPIPPHGAELRGMDLVVKSPTTEGRFGFMFKNQPPFPASDTLLDSLGATMEEEPTADAVSTTERPKRRQRRLRRKPQPTPHIRVHFRWSVHRPRHHLRHHEARMISSPTPTRQPTSACPATTSTPSTDWAPHKPPVLQPQRPGQVPDR